MDSSTATPSIERASEILSLIQRGREYAASHKREFAPDWYPWQERFFAASKDHSAVMLLSANQVGKTTTSGYQDALDLTGDYPETWQGLRINHPVNLWAMGVDNNQLKEVLQRELIGELGEGDTVTGGWVHPDEIVSITRSQTPGLAKEVKIRHKSGGVSTLSFKAHTQARTGSDSLPFAGSRVDVIHCDEQPPDEIIGQLVTRTLMGRQGKGGVLRYTLTPEMGLTNLVDQFMNHAAPHQALVGPVAWEECPHITPKRAAEMLTSYPPHEREMRSKGIPLFGTGRIFSFDEADVLIEPFRLEDKPWLKVIRSLDIGINHPTAIAWLAHDPEQAITYLVRTYRKAGDPAPLHASVANSLWPNAPLVFPHDADNREKGSGESVKAIYEQCGIKHSLTFANPDPGDSNYVEPGLMSMQLALATGKLKVFKGQAQEFIEESRSYHRDNRGQIVKERDDVIDAVRYGFQMVGRYGVPIAERAYANAGGLYPQLGLQKGKAWQRQASR